jgi:hypothetical protein
MRGCSEKTSSFQPKRPAGKKTGRKSDRQRKTLRVKILGDIEPEEVIRKADNKTIKKRTLAGENTRKY